MKAEEKEKAIADLRKQIHVYEMQQRALEVKRKEMVSELMRVEKIPVEK